MATSSLAKIMPSVVAMLLVSSCHFEQHKAAGTVYAPLGESCQIRIPERYELVRKTDAVLSYALFGPTPGAISIRSGNFNDQLKVDLRESDYLYAKKYEGMLVTYKVDKRASRPVAIARITLSDSLLIVTGKDAANFQSYVSECFESWRHIKSK